MILELMEAGQQEVLHDYLIEQGLPIPLPHGLRCWADFGFGPGAGDGYGLELEESGRPGCGYAEGFGNGAGEGDGSGFLWGLMDVGICSGTGAGEAFFGSGAGNGTGHGSWHGMGRR